jgi:DNA-binding NarL/FixJ family response regulator
MRVVLIGDQPLWQEAVVDVLSQRFGKIEPLAATSVEAALQLIDQSNPQLILADFAIEDLRRNTGIEAVVESGNCTPVIVFDAFMVVSHAKRAARAGAKGYITKTSTRALIDAAVGLVMAGGLYHPDIPEDERPSAAMAPWLPGLSGRQREVLELVMQGKSNGEIAAALGLALPTVKSHVHGILRAAGLRSRTQLVVQGLGAPSRAC